MAAFGGLVLPCLSCEDPYLQLSIFMTDLSRDKTLQANVEASKRLTRMLGTEFVPCTDDLGSLAKAFSVLEDGEVYKVCDRTMLKMLRILVEAGLNYHRTSPSPHPKVERLNQLLKELKGKVRAWCYGYVRWQWESLKMGWRDIYTNPAFDKFNDEGWKELDLFRRLIYHPKETEESIIVNDKRLILKILYKGLLVNDQFLSFWANGSDKFKAYVQGLLIDRCSSIIKSDLIVQLTVGPLREALALERMELPGEQDASQFDEHYNMIYPLPTYLICEWLNSKSEDELKILIEDVRELVINNGGEPSSRERARNVRQRSEW